MDQIITSLKAVSDKIRLRILLLLLDREACVCELMAVFRLAQSKLSHHLIILREAELLEDDKRGKWNYYRVNTKLLNPANRALVISISHLLVDNETIEKDKRNLTTIKERMGICC